MKFWTTIITFHGSNQQTTKRSNDPSSEDAANKIDHDAYKQSKIQAMAKIIPLIAAEIKGNPLALQSSSIAIKGILKKHPDIPIKDVLPRYIVTAHTSKGMEIVDFFDSNFPGGIKLTFNYFFPNISGFTYDQYVDYKNKHMIDNHTAPAQETAQTVAADMIPLYGEKVDADEYSSQL